MILQRFGTALRRQDWATVAIEFSVVVLGIFVALQAEDWNQERRDRQLEQVYLGRLIDETGANIATLRQYERIFEDKIRFIVALPDLPLPPTIERDPAAFMDRLDNSSWIAIAALRSESYEELESSGRLALLRDARLRSEIASFLNDYSSTQLVLSQPIGDYRRLLFEALPGQAYHEYRTGDEVTDTAAVARSLDALREDPRFPAAANAEVAYGADALYWIREFLKRSERILVQLEARDGSA